MAATSVSSPSDVLNISLRRIGYTLRVGSLLDGSKAASMALDIYAQTRDELLRMGNWYFAQGQVNGILQKEAPPNGYFDAPWSTAFPQQPWAYQYAYPEDAVKIRAVRPQPGFLFDPMPTPKLFATANDASLTPPAQVVLCNVPSALIVYTRRVTNPSNWESDFVEAMAAALGRRLAPVLANMEAAQMVARDESISIGLADKVQG